MKAIFRTIAGPMVLVAAWVAVSSAQATCPPEVASARAMLTARGGEALASASQDAQPARSQDVQAPRNQDVQAPRSQASNSDPARSSINEPQSARALVVEAEAACQAGNTAQAREKALAALEVMKQ